MVKHFPVRAGIGERRIDILHSYLHRLANVFEANIAHQSPRQKSRFAKNLKTIADAEHQPAAIGELAHRFHDR